MKFNLFIFILLLSSQVNAQDSILPQFPWILNGQLCYIQSNGKIIKTTNNKITYPTAPLLKDSIIRFNQYGIWGFKDLNGKIIIPAGYEKAGHFRHGFAWVKLDYKRYYFIDIYQKPLIEFTFDRCFDFQDGMGRVFDKNESKGYNGYGFISTNGKVTIPLQYKKAYDFVQGYALVQDKELKWWLIDKNGQSIQGPCIGLQSNKNMFFFNKN